MYDEYEPLIKFIVSVSPYIESIAILLLGLILFRLNYLIKTKKATEENYKTYSERLLELTQNLSKSTKEVDKILLEMTAIAMDRENALHNLEADLSKLEKREEDAKKRIQDLESVPLAVAEHFAQLTSVGEKRSAKRDYYLFAAGVIVSTLVGILSHSQYPCWHTNEVSGMGVGFNCC